MKNQHFVVVGGGPAGQAAIDSLLQSGFGGKITLISKEPHPPYARIVLSKNFEAKAEKLPLKSGDFYKQNNINLRLN